MKTFDYLIVGSGCSGAMSAQTLVEAGVDVVMLDVGEKDDNYAKLIPDNDFISIRRHEQDQYKYFIGKDAKGIGWSDIGKGAQITPPRKYMLNSIDSLIPLASKTFSPLESLGYGGLGIAWGLQCWEYSDADLRAAGLDVEGMREGYETVSKRIGVSGTDDGAARYTLGSLKTYQASPDMDRNHRRIYKKYLRREKNFNEKGLYLGRTPLALITQDLGRRKKYAYRDMDFYSDNDQSAWRPWITVSQLRKKKNFRYINRHLVTRFDEKTGYIEVSALNVDDGQETTFRCRKLILATSALGSARIALRSFREHSRRLPLLCNPYTYIPCLQPAMMGKAVEPKKLGFAQLSLFLDQNQNNQDVSVASLYSYQSLMMLRTIRQLPFDLADSREILRYVMTGIVIMALHHPDNPSPDKFVQLSKTKTRTGDTLTASYALSPEDELEYAQRKKQLTAAMRRMGTYPLKQISPVSGASVHYAGTLPFSDKDTPFTLSRSGRLHGTKHVYVADSSGFNYLPAPGLTFSLMTNAHLVATEVLNEN